MFSQNAIAETSFHLFKNFLIVELGPVGLRSTE
jgi:hypothetical protein